MRLVLDVSVAVKWVLPEAHREADLDRALAILGQVRSGEIEPLQPPHWLAEVAAVLVRLAPEGAQAALDLLYAMELPVAEDLEVYRRAVTLSRSLDHPLFDTLYHAVALEHGGTLVTADDRYYRKAEAAGRLVRLGDWAAASTGAGA
jgi:predicted nucleic acid-binding protein